jgi:hypothetical protein
MNMFSVGKITKYWLILFKIEVKTIILFVPMYCGTNSCNTFSRSERGAETTSQTFQFLIDILNQNQVVEQVYTDI